MGGKGCFRLSLRDGPGHDFPKFSGGAVRPKSTPEPIRTAVVISPPRPETISEALQKGGVTVA
jgi:hypothetical protein